MFEWLFGKPKDKSPSESISESIVNKWFEVKDFKFYDRLLYTDGKKYYYIERIHHIRKSKYNLRTIDGDLISSVEYLSGCYNYSTDSKEDAEIFGRLKKVDEKDLCNIYQSIKNKSQFYDIIIDHTVYGNHTHLKFAVDGYVLINKELLIIHRKQPQTCKPYQYLAHKYSINVNTETVIDSNKSGREWFIKRLLNGDELKGEIISESEYLEKYHHILALHSAAKIEEVKQKFLKFIQWHLDYHRNVNKSLEANAADPIPPIDTYEKFELFIEVKKNYFDMLKYPEDIRVDEHYPKSPEFKLFAINYFEKGNK